MSFWLLVAGILFVCFLALYKLEDTLGKGVDPTVEGLVRDGRSDKRR